MNLKKFPNVRFDDDGCFDIELSIDEFKVVLAQMGDVIANLNDKPDKKKQ